MTPTPAHDDLARVSGSAGPEEIAAAIAVLRAGGVVAFPTETVYGLGADALDAAAVRRVFELKGRPPTNPLIVHVSGEAMARRVAAHWPPEASRLAQAFWPGPLTLVLPKAAHVPPEVTAGGPTVALRCPDHRVTLALLDAFAHPLVGPSANPSGGVSPTTAEHVREAFEASRVYVLEGGPCRGGIESTVLDLTSSPPCILRPGPISAAQIAAVLGGPVAEHPLPGDVPASGAVARSPGLHPVHYAPRARAVLFERQHLADMLARTHRAVVITHSGLTVSPPHQIIRMPASAPGYAARLYAALREADALRPDLIAIERPPADDPLWRAILDRLTRATGGL